MKKHYLGFMVAVALCLVSKPTRAADASVESPLPLGQHTKRLTKGVEDGLLAEMATKFGPAGKMGTLAPAVQLLWDAECPRGALLMAMIGKDRKDPTTYLEDALVAWGIPTLEQGPFFFRAQGPFFTSPEAALKASKARQAVYMALTVADKGLYYAITLRQPTPEEEKTLTQMDAEAPADKLFYKRAARGVEHTWLSPADLLTEGVLETTYDKALIYVRVEGETFAVDFNNPVQPIDFHAGGVTTAETLFTFYAPTPRSRKGSLLSSPKKGSGKGAKGAKLTAEDTGDKPPARSGSFLGKGGRGKGNANRGGRGGGSKAKGRRSDRHPPGGKKK